MKQIKNLSELLEKALKLKAGKTGLPYTMDRVAELLGQRRVCECGEPLPKDETYCELCQEMYQDRLETERLIQQEEIRRED